MKLLVSAMVTLIMTSTAFGIRTFKVDSKSSFSTLRRVLASDNTHSFVKGSEMTASDTEGILKFLKIARDSSENDFKLSKPEELVSYLDALTMELPMIGFHLVSVDSFKGGYTQEGLRGDWIQLHQFFELIFENANHEVISRAFSLQRSDWIWKKDR